MRQPTWKLLIYACIIAFLFGYLIGKTSAQKEAMEVIDDLREARFQSDLVAQRAGEELKKAMEDIARMFTWNESSIEE